MFNTIIWATDGSAAADLALPYAKALASTDGGRIVAVHCNELLVGRAGGAPALADEDDLEAKIRAQVADAQRDGVDVSFRLATAPAPHAAHAIADIAREIDADAIVVGTRGHGTIAGLLLGSVTHRLLHIAPCPVVAVPATRAATSAARERETAATVA